MFDYSCFIIYLWIPPSLYHPQIHPIFLILAYWICSKWYLSVGTLTKLSFFSYLVRKKNRCSLRTSFSLVSLLCIDTNIVPLWCHSQRMKQGSADGLLAMLSELKVQMLQFCAVPLAQALRTVFQGPCGLDHHEWLGTSMCSVPYSPSTPFSLKSYSSWVPPSFL